MHDHKKALKIRCPMCFIRDIDVVFLHYDERGNEYYCKKCAYSADLKEIEDTIEQSLKRRYKDRLKPHPFTQDKKSGFMGDTPERKQV